MANDTIIKTLAVAGVLSVVCSALVSSSAVLLRPQQAINKDLDRKQNILQAAGIYEGGKSIDDQFSRFEIQIVDLASGDFRHDIDPVSFDQRKAAKDPSLSVAISKDQDIAGIKRRSLYAPVYLSRNDSGNIEQLILPVHGKGLWSTMYGYLALESDLSTISGFAFYQHGETPGLGGEVDNPRWKALWPGKQAFNAAGEITIDVLKGKTDPNSPHISSQVDGLSGATITTRGIDALLDYWLGENGFAPFLTQLKSQNGGNPNG